jgi:hypothetical protein
MKGKIMRRKFLGTMSMLVVAGAVTVACGLLQSASTITQAEQAFAALVTCVTSIVAAGKVPGDGTIEAAVEACGVAAADVYTTAQAIEAFEAAASSDAGAAAGKIRALPRRAKK